MFSIDQNCHPLWDVVPKLQALARRGLCVKHFIEDVDVAFTSLGSAVGASSLRLTRERFHRSGGADWGAAMFYLDFLGRLPTEIRRWEVQTGMKTSVLARRVGRSVDDLYDEFSPSDNWQLIGGSYVGDHDHHRVVGDLSVSETGEFLREILEKARANCLASFPQEDSRRRVTDWFDREQQRVERLLTECAGGKLVDLYGRWMGEYIDEHVTLEAASSLFACDADPARTAVLELFLADYDLATGLYNEALAETSTGLRPLKTSEGELPFFATVEHQGHLVRTGVYLDGETIRIGEGTIRLTADRRIPPEQLIAAGVHCLAGKAIVLVIQVRVGPDGGALVVPYRGSLYMPAAQRLAAKFHSAGMLPGELRPIVRVRFRLLDRMRELDTVIRLPPHLAASFGTDEIPARRFGENYSALAGEAARRLESFEDPEARARWAQESFPEEARAIDGLERRRRELSVRDPKSPEIRSLGKQQKQLQVELLWRLIRRIALDTQLMQIDYFDSRGALIPWCVALGGERWYDHVLDNAELCDDTPPETGE